METSEEDTIENQPGGEPVAKPIAAIVGRPNVGKSALLNRIIQRREAIVEAVPGVTRDRIYRDTEWCGKNFTLIDTGGILINDPDNMKQMIKLQVDAAIDEADLILFVVDIREGLHPLDYDVADLLRKTNKKIIIVANKADDPSIFPHAAEFFSLGMGDPIPVSAVHGTGTGELLDEMIQNLPDELPETEEESFINLSIVGRPNVGKSSLLNAILGEERAIVTDIPGTTRDIVDSNFKWGDRHFVIVDTAGIRRKSKVTENVEYYSTQRAKQAIKRSNVGLLVLDATEAAVLQDKRVGGLLHEEGKGLIVVVNKWDLLVPEFNSTESRELMQKYEVELRGHMDFMSYAPVLFTSAAQSRGLNNILPTVIRVYTEAVKRIDTSVLNQVFQEAFRFRPPPSYKGQSLKLYYVHQGDVNPPTFVFKVNSPKLVHFSYKRYLENQLRRALGFEGTPIRFIFKK
jgi:GTPase